MWKNSKTSCRKLFGTRAGLVKTWLPKHILGICPKYWHLESFYFNHSVCTHVPSEDFEVTSCWNQCLRIGFGNAGYLMNGKLFKTPVQVTGPCPWVCHGWSPLSSWIPWLPKLTHYVRVSSRWEYCLWLFGCYTLFVMALFVSFSPHSWLD